ncbi:RNHCP domain-containing protein [Candidatus Peregrinibacteria bacterium]|nr:RNHCP domain-containing protein [Candidatus Peregrinibacteria bacterium]
MNKRKNFILVNQGFVCENCGEANPPVKGTCRNHCRKCLYSKHVDDKIPGDRKSTCKSLMIPIELDKNGKKGYIIIHRCLKCGKTIKNKVAEDDDFNIIIKLAAYKHI